MTLTPIITSMPTPGLPAESFDLALDDLLVTDGRAELLAVVVGNTLKLAEGTIGGSKVVDVGSASDDVVTGGTGGTTEIVGGMITVDLDLDLELGLATVEEVTG